MQWREKDTIGAPMAVDTGVGSSGVRRFCVDGREGKCSLSYPQPCLVFVPRRKSYAPLFIPVIVFLFQRLNDPAVTTSFRPAEILPHYRHVGVPELRS